MRKTYLREYLPSFRKKRCVVKIGSSLLADSSNGVLDTKAIRRYVNDVANLMKNKWQVILVSSGAVAAGMSVLRLNRRPSSIKELQSCAAIGQVSLMSSYEKSFSKKGMHCAQILLTADDLSHRDRYLNAKNTIELLLKEGVVPVVNENDSVATDEIAFGDNDMLSALVAGACDASVLVILSDVDGLYMGIGQEKRLARVVDEVTDEVFSWVYKSRGKTTKGGMHSKLKSAASASQWGIYTFIASGRKRNVVSKILVSARQEGTLFLPKEKKASARRLWLLHIAKPKGTIYIDEGAEHALVRGKKSLLCPGILSVEGAFSKSDVVEIRARKGTLVAKAITSMPVEELTRYLGKRYEKEAAHRDNIAITIP